MSMNEQDALQQYDDFLDECYGTINICGLDYSASVAFKEVDPIAYRCGFNDYCDAENIEIEE